MAARKRQSQRAPSAELMTPKSTSPRALAGGRLSLDNSNLFIGAAPVIMPPPNHEDIWRWGQFDSKTFDHLSAGQIAGYLADLSPEVSRALYDFLRMCNPGWELTALTPGTEEPDPQAQVALDAIMNMLGETYGSPDVPINRLFMAAWMRGALLAELVLDEAGRMPVDLAIPDPYWVRFQRMQDPVRGTIHQLGQMQGGKFVLLDRPTICYIPVDPVPGVPYGRSLVAPGLFTALFLVGLLHDLRRVISQQGYPRADVIIKLEALRAQMPDDIRGDPEQENVWLTAIQDAITSAYNTLQPDDAWVHTDIVEMGKPVGTVDANSLGGIGPIMDFLERMSVRALKTAPFMMCLDARSPESTANREWEQLLQTIKSMQHLAECLLERLFGLGLQAQGVVTTVRFRFAENRASERQRDALTEQTLIANARAKYDNGWISQDQAAAEGAGVMQADVPEPRAVAAPPSTTPAVPADHNPDPGSARAVETNGHADVRELLGVTS